MCNIWLVFGRLILLLDCQEIGCVAIGTTPFFLAFPSRLILCLSLKRTIRIDPRFRSASSGTDAFHVLFPDKDYFGQGSQLHFVVVPPMVSTYVRLTYPSKQQCLLARSFVCLKSNVPPSHPISLMIAYISTESATCPHSSLDTQAELGPPELHALMHFYANNIYLRLK